MKNHSVVAQLDDSNRTSEAMLSFLKIQEFLLSQRCHDVKLNKAIQFALQLIKTNTGTMLVLLLIVREQLWPYYKAQILITMNQI